MPFDRPGAVPLAGRVQEQATMASALSEAADGRPSALLVHGEAGVGKTRLLSEVARRARAQGFGVLWARCLSFGGGSAPYLPLVSAFEVWLDEVGEEGRARLVAEAPGIAELVPSLGGSVETVPQRALTAVDRAVDALAGRQPLLFVFDDLHWADVSSRDVLAYVLSGLRQRRLVVVGTYRDDGLGEGHPLHGWLADVRRLPGVVEVGLHRLTLEETHEQVAGLLGRDPGQDLVEAVLVRSGGNPYLTRLLCEALPPGSTSLPEEVPEALRGALLASWHRLGPTTRSLVRVIAVAGRPMPVDLVSRVSVAHGLDTHAVAAALREADDAGVVHLEPQGGVWFRHPLLADVLYGTLLPDEAVTLHRWFVTELNAQQPLDPARMADLAIHLHRAGMLDEAFEQYLVAADAAVTVGAYPEEAQLRLSAARLWPRVGDPVRARHASHQRLLGRAARALRRSGDVATALTVATEAKNLPGTDDPLSAAFVRVLWYQLAATSGRYTRMPATALEEAVELAAAYPDRPERAMALAELAQHEVWSGHPERAREYAAQALAAARRSGEPGPLSYAYGASALAHLGEPRAGRDAAMAHGVALRSGRPEYVALAAVQRATVHDAHGRVADVAQVLLDGAQVGMRAGLAGITQLLGAHAAYALAGIGRFDEAEAVLRHVLSSRPVGLAGVTAREAAVTVALRRGRLDEATTHLSRLRELSPRFEEVPGFAGATVLAEYLVATGRPQEALEMLIRTIGAHAHADPRYADQMLVWGAWAAAEVAQAARDRRDRVGEKRANVCLDRLLQARRSVDPPPAADAGRNLVQRANRLLFRAERRRALGRPDPRLWRAAEAVCATAGMPFARAFALYRLAECVLRGGAHVQPAARRQAAEALRTARRLTVEMGAAPLGDAVVALAQDARIPLAEPVPPPIGSRDGVAGGDEGAEGAEGAGAGQRPRLTPREREVLGHLVAGRSYAEIATALFISEKTVSVHVSNLLRKTGASGRVQLAALARRQGLVTHG